MLAYELDQKPTTDPDASPAGRFDPSGKLVRAGLPVLERLTADLGDIAIRVELADADAKVLATAEGDRPRAGERGGVSCVSVPIDDPRRDSPAGFVGVKAATEVGALMVPYAQLAARMIAERMLDAASVGDRALVEHFLRARRRARGPILAINDREVLVNAAAARLVDTVDHGTIRNWAMDLLERHDASDQVLQLRVQAVTAHCEPVMAGDELIGALVYMSETRGAPRTGRRSRAREQHTPTRGWASLRPSELGIAALVADGLTNREVGARLFVSPHTVDSYLRQIFRKLSITSRIELTRMVIEHTDRGNLAVLS